MVRRSLVGVLSVATLAACLLAGPPASASTIHVDCASTALQPKINGATAGSTLLLTGTCVGTFTITKNLTLKGNPEATLDAEQQGSTVSTHTGLVHLTGLTIIGGVAPRGGGINQAGGKLVLTHVTLSGNLAAGETTAAGGGIYSTGTLSVVSSNVLGNQAFSEDAGLVGASGGGIVATGALVITKSTVSGNVATAISTGFNAGGGGAGVYDAGTFLKVTSSHVDHNRGTYVGAKMASAQSAGLIANNPGGQFTITGSTFDGNVLSANSTTTTSAAVSGGAVLEGAKLTVTSSSFSKNHLHATGHTGAEVAAGGVAVGPHSTLTDVRVIGNHSVATSDAGGAFAGGGGFAVSQGPATIASSTVSNNSMVATMASGLGLGEGGGIESSTGLVKVLHTTVDHDRLVITAASGQPVVSGGGLAIGGNLTLVGSTVSNSVAMATTAGVGTITASGGGIALTAANGHSVITNSTIANDSASATADPASGTAIAQGGGLATRSNSVQVKESTIDGNAVTGAGHTLTVQGGGVFVSAGTTSLLDSILALNAAPSTSDGQNCFGPVGSGGHGVMGNVLGCTYTAGPGDLVNADPKLGPLATNGGPTKTQALLAGSPAIDHAPTAACPVKVDQRGVHRPQGPACDSGSFERT